MPKTFNPDSRCALQVIAAVEVNAPRTTTMKQIEAACSTYRPATLSSTAIRLATAGMIVRVERGVYAAVERERHVLPISVPPLGEYDDLAEIKALLREMINLWKGWM